MADDEPVIVDEPEKNEEDISGLVNAKEAEIDRYITAGNFGEALRVALADPPFASKNQAAKLQYAKAVCRILFAVRDSDINNMVNNLSVTPDCDVLMKFIYKGLSVAENSGTLLRWHQAVFDRAGLGSIIRAMVDRKTA